MGMMSKEIFVMLILTWHRGKSNGLNFGWLGFSGYGGEKNSFGIPSAYLQFKG